jgi:hypothetical protein
MFRRAPALVSIRRCLARVAFAAGLALALLGVPSRSAQAASAVLEIADEDSGWVEAKMVRRLVTLELADVSVPEPSGRLRSARPGLFVRVLRFDTQTVVELWHRGELFGQRRLTIAGSPQVRARRIALAAGELARGLRERRLLEEKKARKRNAKQALDASQRRGLPIYALPAVTPAVYLGVLGPGDVWWWGPELGVTLSSAKGPLLGLRGAALFAATPGISALRGLELWEIGLAPGYAWRLNSTTRLAFALDASAAVVRALGSVRLLSGGTTTWTARGGFELRLVTKLTRTVELFAGPELGVVLRPVLAADEAGQDRFGGVWSGLRLGVAFTPQGAW